MYFLCKQFDFKRCFVLYLTAILHNKLAVYKRTNDNTITSVYFRPILMLHIHNLFSIKKYKVHFIARFIMGNHIFIYFLAIVPGQQRYKGLQDVERNSNTHVHRILPMELDKRG